MNYAILYQGIKSALGNMLSKSANPAALAERLRRQAGQLATQFAPGTDSEQVIELVERAIAEVVQSLPARRLN